jgi:predicted nuclease with RNAse H fold
MKIVGIDLSGPSNPAATSLTCLDAQGTSLSYCVDMCRSGLDDQHIYTIIKDLVRLDSVVIGLDAPLSYNIGGKDRPGDRELRKIAVAHGLRSGTIMPPTFNRMAYLTLRGISIARALEYLTQEGDIRIVEVHPGVALAMRGAPATHIVSLKSDPQARASLLAWIRATYIPDLPSIDAPSDHVVMSIASALAALDWGRKNARWVQPAEPPFHPYDFAC